MLISTRGRYALRILVDMAERQSDVCIPLKDIAERQDISEKYLESIVRDLVKNNVVTGVRGKGGGYQLKKSPDRINVGEILRYMEGSLSPVACLEEGAVPCERAAECRTLEFWRGLNDVIYKYTSGYTLADLMHKAQPGNDYVI